MNIRSVILILAICVLIFSACKKGPGQGGNSFIRGKVYAYYYNKTLTTKLDSAYAPDEDVYIIYGDDYTYGDKQKTSHDGSYEFRYLKKGSYKIYVYSRDSTGASQGNVNTASPNIAVIQSVSISKKKQTLEVPLITVLK